MTTERGRPRSFDPKEALEQALAVFWRHGYQGASYSDLTAATGLTKPSLYAAFGDKEALYLKCLQHYVETHLRQPSLHLAANLHGREAMARFLHGMVDLLTDPALPGGCFLFTGTMDSGGATMSPAVEAALKKAIHSGETQLRARLQAAQRKGELPPEADPQALATCFTTLLAGLAVQARNGVPKNRLHQVVDSTLGLWPCRPPTRRKTP